MARDLIGSANQWSGELRFKHPNGWTEVIDHPEQAMWDSFRVQALQLPGGSQVMMGPLFSQFGYHPQVGRQVVRTWDSEGLVQSLDNGNRARITSRGRVTLSWELPLE